MRLRIRGKEWEYLELDKVTLRGKECWGRCDPPGAKGKQIQVSTVTSGLEHLDSIIHEVLHASSWDMSEYAVHGTSTAISTALWRLGYRRK
jgi:hypothetical protein